MSRLSALERLGVATGHIVTADERTLYLERLTPYSEAAVSAGCRALETTCTFFPRLAEVVESVQIAARHVTSEDDRRTWVSCPDCHDTGWVFGECSGAGTHRACGRPTDKGFWRDSVYVGVCQSKHAFVSRCRHAR